MQGRNMDGVPPIRAQIGDHICSLGTCPVREPNPQPAGYRTTLQPTEPRQSRQEELLTFILCRECWSRLPSTPNG